MNVLIYDENTGEADECRRLLEDLNVADLKIHIARSWEEVQRLSDFQNIQLLICAVNEDARMPGWLTEAAGKNPKLNILILASDSRLAMDAWTMDASGYLLRPLTEEALKHQLEVLRYPVTEKPRVHFHCLGNFEIYIDDQPVRFQYQKTKELMAYLVDRHGVFCTIGEIQSVLWQDDRNHSSYFKTIRKDLYDTLEFQHLGGLIQKKRNQMGLDIRLCSCDYYEWEKKKQKTFRGEYMSQYSWAEYTTGLLVNARKKQG